jgi:outer membrane murein-binding lipoprotein Lpp
MMASGGMPPMGQPNMMAMGGMPPISGSPYADGGMADAPKKNPIKDFFSDINLVEALIMALGVAAFLYAINYYKFQMNLSKTSVADLNARISKLESDSEKRKAAERNANAAGGMRARKRILM